MKAITSATDRIRLCRLIELIDQNQKFSTDIGIETCLELRNDTDIKSNKRTD